MTTKNEVADSDTVDLAEYDRLREEIDNRTGISTNLILAYVTVLGAGISFFDKAPDVFLGLAAISSFFWLLWMDHTTQIYKIGSYIGLRLASRIQKRHPEGLGWEQYFRTLDKGGESAAKALFGDKAAGRGDVEIQHTRTITRYIMLLFGGTTPVLLGLYIILVLREPLLLFFSYHFGPRDPSIQLDFDAIIRSVGLLLTAGLWVYAIYHYLSFCKSIEVISKALLVKASAAA